MKIIDRYMVKGFLGPFIWCIVAFTIIAIIADIFSFIDNIVKYKIPFASILSFYVYYCPTIFIMVAPMASLLSTIYVLSNLNKNNEITAMKSSGISLWRVLSPILIIGFIVSIIVFIVNDRIIPVSSRVSNFIRTDELEKFKGNKPTSIQNVAVYGAGNRIIFARSYDIKKKVLEDIIIHQHDRTEKLLLKITAQKGEWTREGWKFHKVIMYHIDNSGKFLSEPEFFDEKIIRLRERPSDFATKEWNSDYVSYKELKNYINNFRGTGIKLVKALMVDLYYKVSFPLITVVIILIGAPFALITTRGGVLIGIGMSVAIGLLYYAVIAMSIAFGKNGLLPPIVAAWLGNVVFAILGIHLVNKRA